MFQLDWNLCHNVCLLLVFVIVQQYYNGLFSNHLNFLFRLSIYQDANYFSIAKEGHEAWKALNNKIQQITNRISLDWMLCWKFELAPITIRKIVYEGCIYLSKLDEEFFNVTLTEKKEAKYEEHLNKESYSGNLYKPR